MVYVLMLIYNVLYVYLERVRSIYTITLHQLGSAH